VRYRVVVTPKGQRGLASLPPRDAERVAAGIAGLADDPRPITSSRLTGSLSHLRRLRVGDYRVGYEIDEAKAVVIVRAVGNRRGFYERLRRSH